MSIDYDKDLELNVGDAESVSGGRSTKRTAAKSSAHASSASVMPSLGGIPAPSSSGPEDNQPYQDEDIEC